MKTFRRLAIFVLMVMPPAFSSGRVMAAGEPVIDGTEQILLLVGRSAVIHTDRAIQRVSLSTPDIADALVTAPRELRARQSAGDDLAVRLERQRPHHELRSDRPPRPDAARRANPAAVPERADRRRRQRQDVVLSASLREVRHRRAKFGGRLRRQAGKHRQPDAQTRTPRPTR